MASPKRLRQNLRICVRTGSWKGPPRGKKAPRVGISSSVFGVREESGGCTLSTQTPHACANRLRGQGSALKASAVQSGFRVQDSGLKVQGLLDTLYRSNNSALVRAAQVLEHPPHPYTFTPAHPYIVTPLHRYTLTPVHPYTLTPLHPYTLTPPILYPET